MFIDDIFNEFLFCKEKQKIEKLRNCSIYSAAINIQNKNKCLVVISSSLDKNSVKILILNEFFNYITLTNVNNTSLIKSNYYSIINLSLYFIELTNTKRFANIKTLKMEDIQNVKYKGVDIIFNPKKNNFSFSINLFFLGKHYFENKIIGVCKKEIDELLNSEEKVSQSESEAYQDEKNNFETVYGC